MSRLYCTDDLRNIPVSYTHLDVYKRQACNGTIILLPRWWRISDRHKPNLRAGEETVLLRKSIVVVSAASYEETSSGTKTAGTVNDKTIGKTKGDGVSSKRKNFLVLT